MGHYAKVLNGVVIDCIVADEEFFETFVDSSPGTWIQTSYNTRGGVYYIPNTDIPDPDQTKAIRGNFAGIGHIYDPAKDVFYPPQPYPSWTLDETRWIWQAPVERPTDGKLYQWNEENQNWQVAFGG